MEEKITEKKVWESPEVEIINTKLTNGGTVAYGAGREDAWYYDTHTS